MRVALIGINFAPELTGIAVYNTGMAEFLRDRGIEVDVYTGFPYYPEWRKAARDRWRWFARERHKGIAVSRHYLYCPSRLSAVKRMAHELSFVVAASIGYLFGRRAHCTLIVSPPLFLTPPILLLARLKGSRTLVHVQDLQPDAAVELGMLRPGPLTSFFYFVERLGYRLAHRVSSISRGMLDRIERKGVAAKKTLLLRNWADDDRVRPLPHATTLRADWGLDGCFVALYAGNMGVKQGLNTLLEAAALLQHEPRIRFVVVGDGGEKERLLVRARELGLDNLRFEPLQPVDRLAELLATADVALIPQKREAGDLVLPSKLANIMASARPVVAAARPDTELGRIVTEAECGVLVEPENPNDMAAAICTLFRERERCLRLGESGRRYMEQRLRRDAVLADLVTALQELRGAAPASAFQSEA